MRESSEGDLRVAAIVPAYNEEATLTEVLSVLKATPVVGEILVVSDGSTDRTVEIARALGLRTIHLRENQGKGRAMAIGVAHTDAPILLFVDGDVMYNLKHLVKEKKRGLIQGSRARFRMFAAVFGAWLVLQVRPPALRRHRERLAAGPVLNPELEYINF